MNIINQLIKLQFLFLLLWCLRLPFTVTGFVLSPCRNTAGTGTKLILYYKLIYRFMHIYTYIYWILTDAMNKERAKTSLKNIYLSLYCNVYVWEGPGDWTKTAIYWPPLLWWSVLCLSRSPGLLNRRPGGPLCWLSLLHLITNWSPNSIVGPHLVSNSFFSNCPASCLDRVI